MADTKKNTIEEKTVKVKVKDIAQSPYKLRLVADTVRGLDAEEALNTVEFLNRKGAITVKKALLSAIDSAVNKYGVDKKDLMVSHISVDGARVLRKAIYATKGRFSLGKKRRSHLNLELKVK
jgi:large subunit ribosomal protein L22